MKIEIKDKTNKLIPQANDVYKLINLCKYILDTTEEQNDDRLMKNIEVNTTRQLEYYMKAAEFLDLIIIEKKELTEIGKIIFCQSNEIMLKLVLFKMLECDVCAIYYLTRNKKSLFEYIKKTTKLSESTIARRMNTIIKWVNWCDLVLLDYPEKDLKILTRVTMINDYFLEELL